MANGDRFTQGIFSLLGIVVALPIIGTAIKQVQRIGEQNPFEEPKRRKR